MLDRAIIMAKQGATFKLKGNVRLSHAPNDLANFSDWSSKYFKFKGNVRFSHALNDLANFSDWSSK